MKLSNENLEVCLIALRQSIATESSITARLRIGKTLDALETELMARQFGTMPTTVVTGSAVDHPAHYGGKDDPYEAIKVIEAWGLGFNLGNALKYLARAGKKGDAIEDLEKLGWYNNREIQNRKKAGK